MYDSVRDGAYAIQASVGWKSLLFYMVLVYMLVKFLYTYIKRFIVVAILTLMAPLIGVLYSLDKVKDNKAQSYGKWLKEYLFNVIIQSVHALLYSLFMGLAFNIAKDSASGVFIAVMLMMFILKAEVIFKQIFGIKSGNMTDVLKKSVGIMYGATAVKKIAGANMKVLGKVASPITKPISNIHARAQSIRRNRNIDKLKDKIEQARRSGQTKVKVGRTGGLSLGTLIEGKQALNIDGYDEQTDSGKIAKDLFEKKEKIDKDARKEFTARLSQVENTAIGMAESAVAIPMIAVEGVEGTAMLLSAKKHFNKGINAAGMKIKKPRTVKDKVKYISMNMLTGGVYGKIINLSKLNKDYLEKKNNKVNNAQYEAIKKKLDKSARKEFQRLLNDATIDETELRRAYSQVKTKISKDTITNAVMRVDVNNTTEVTYKVEQIINTTTDMNQVSKQVNSTMQKQYKDIEFDKEKFDLQIKNDIKRKIASNRGIRPSRISEQEVEREFVTLSTAEREKIVKKALGVSSNLTERKLEENKEIIKEKKAHTEMNLQDVNNIIEAISEETGKIKTDNFKTSFKSMTTYQIALVRTGKTNVNDLTASDVSSVSNADIDNFIASMTHDELIKNIARVSRLNTSVVDDDLRAKPEYRNLMDIVEKSKDLENKMKGNK